MTILSRIRSLYRDPQQAVLGGVCAGIAESLDVDVLLVRVTTIVLFIMTFGLITALYLILLTILPVKPSESGVIEIKPLSVSSERYGKIVMGATRRKRPKPEEKRSYHRLITRVCIVLLCLEIAFLAILAFAGVFSLELFTVVGSPIGILLMVAPIFLLAAIVFDNTACYVIAVLLILALIMVIFFGTGVLDPTFFFAPLEPESTLTLAV